MILLCALAAASCSEKSKPAQPAKAKAAVDPVEVLRKEGRELFNTRCIVCHMENGQGQPGAYPPLVGSPFLLDADGAERSTKIVLYGLRGRIVVHGKSYDGDMPNFSLSDRQIAGVLTYVRGAWGNQAPPIPEEFVAGIRKQHGDRGPWTPYEIFAQHPLREK